MNLYTYILDFRGGTYISQVTANSVDTSVLIWVQKLKNEVAEIQFLGLKSITEIAKEVKVQKPQKLSGLQQSWIIDFKIKQGFGIVNIIQTVSTSSDNIKMELEKNEALLLFEYLNTFNNNAFKNHPKITQIFWDIKCALKRQLSEPFLSNYAKIIAKEKEEIALSRKKYLQKAYLIKLLKTENETKLITQLKKHPIKKWLKKPYIRFVNSKNANQKGDEWQIDRTLILKDNVEGIIRLDILQDGRIGGIELDNQLD